MGIIAKYYISTENNLLFYSSNYYYATQAYVKQVVIHERLREANTGL